MKGLLLLYNAVLLEQSVLVMVCIHKKLFSPLTQHAQHKNRDTMYQQVRSVNVCWIWRRWCALRLKGC